MEYTKNEIDFHWIGSPPLYKSGDKVYALVKTKNRVSVCETSILKVPLQYVYDQKHFLFFNKNYEVSNFVLHSKENPCLCPSNYVFKEKTEAELMAKFHPIKLSQEKWLKAIGDRNVKGKYNIHDGCELTSCCAIISSIRDELEKIKKKRRNNRN